MSLSSSTVATGIAALTVSGVTIKNVTAIPDQVNARDCPILFPDPNGWLGGANAEPEDGSTTFGTPTTRMWTFHRTYTYLYLHAPVGSGRGLVDNIPAMATNADLIMTEITELDLTGVDVMAVNCTDFGTFQDPAGGSFFGFRVAITLRERINA